MTLVNCWVCDSSRLPPTILCLTIDTGFYYCDIDRHTWEATYDQGVDVRIITLVISFC